MARRRYKRRSKSTYKRKKSYGRKRRSTSKKRRMGVSGGFKRRRLGIFMQR